MRRYRNPYRPNFGLSASSWSRPDARQSNWRVSSRKGQFDLEECRCGRRMECRPVYSIRYPAYEKTGYFKSGVGNAAYEACGLKAEKSSFPAMRNSTVRMVLKLAYPRALRLAA